MSSLNSGNLIEDGSFKEDLIPYSAPEYWCASRSASAKMIHEKVFLVLLADKIGGKKIDHTAWTVKLVHGERPQGNGPAAVPSNSGAVPLGPFPMDKLDSPSGMLAMWC